MCLLRFDVNIKSEIINGVQGYGMSKKNSWNESAMKEQLSNIYMLT